MTPNDDPSTTLLMDVVSDPSSWAKTAIERARRVGISLNDLSVQADVARSNFPRWVSGVTAPSVRVIARIENVLREAERALGDSPQS